MLDRELWRFINSFADWLSAVGTIGAVVVALYLARRDSWITLRVVVGLRLMLRQGSAERPEYFSLEVTNLGRRPARITNIVMRDGLRFSVKRYGFGAQMVMLPPRNQLSAAVPTTIGDGEGADYLVPWHEFVGENGDEFGALFAGRLGPLRARLFRVGVLTSAGGIFDARIEKPLARRLVQVARERS